MSETTTKKPDSRPSDIKARKNDTAASPNAASQAAVEKAENAPQGLINQSKMLTSRGGFKLPAKEGQYTPENTQEIWNNASENQRANWLVAMGSIPGLYKSGDQPHVIIELTYPRMLGVDELIDSVWLKIYNATSVATSIFVKK